MERKDNLTEMIRHALPATVAVVISKRFDDIEREAMSMFPEIPWSAKRRELAYLKQNVDRHGMLKIGNGSGFIVDPSGIVVSNRHIVNETHDAYTVVTNDGKKYPAKILARDPLSDIAILKIDGETPFPFLSLGDSSRLDLGQPVVTIGNALGIFPNTVSAGIISGLSRSITAQIDARSPVQEFTGLIQTDAAINPGNSGGPLIDAVGKVIGINVAIIQGAQNISFALPINTLKKDLEELHTHGRIRRPFLGIHYVLIDEENRDQLETPVDHGALVISPNPYAHSVVPKSPAATAGIKEHDIVLECDGTPITVKRTLTDILEEHTVGDTLELKILRKRKAFTVKVKLAEKR